VRTLQLTWQLSVATMTHIKPLLVHNKMYTAS
jgi:hypothetical protein